MHKKIISVFVLILIISQNAYAVTPSAKSAVLIDLEGANILYQKNAYQKLPMASTTKIMTAICAIENGNLDDTVEVDKRAVGVEGSSMYLGYGEKITLKNLLYGLMLASGNDAAVAISIHISGSVEEFVKLMNETAKKIGAKDTSFETPNGLDGDLHYTTAYDLALITRYALKNKDFKNIVKTEKITIPWDGKDYGRTLTNHNKLLRTYDGATGVKTGFTKKSGRCLVSSAKKDGTEVVAVTLNCPNDWAEHASMLDYAFDNYKTVKVVKKGDYAKSFDVDFSNVKSVGSEFLNDVNVLVNKNEKNEFLIKYETETHLKAPVKFNQKTGTVKVILNGNVVGQTDIVTKCAADEKEIKRLSYEFKSILIKYIQGVNENTNERNKIAKISCYGKYCFKKSIGTVYFRRQSEG